MHVIISFIVVTVVLGVLIFVHELGHFLVAKLIGVKVEEFAFGFGPRLFAKKSGETEYRINLIPLGGYVKLLGEGIRSELPVESKKLQKLWKEKGLGNIEDKEELEENISKITAKFSSEEKKFFKKVVLEQWAAKYSDRSYSNKPAGKKILILVAGVSMNFLLAVIIFPIYLYLGNFTTDIVKITEYKFIGVDSTTLQSPIIDKAYREDLKELENTLIWEVNGEKIENRLDFLDFLDNSVGETHRYSLIDENGTTIEKELRLNSDSLDTNLDSEVRGGMIVMEIVEGSPVKDTNIKEGAVILSIGGRTFENVDEFTSVLEDLQGQSVVVETINSDGVNETESLTLLTKESEGDPVLGVKFSSNEVRFLEFYNLDYNNNKLLSGVSHSINVLGYQTKALGSLISQSIKQKDIAPVATGVGSVVSVADSINSLVRANNFRDILNLAGLVSIALAFINILPIPLFDGGHILFLLIEKVRGRKLNPKVEEIISQVFFFLLIALSILIMVKDLIIFDWPQRAWKSTEIRYLIISGVVLLTGYLTYKYLLGRKREG